MLVWLLLKHVSSLHGNLLLLTKTLLNKAYTYVSRNLTGLISITVLQVEGMLFHYISSARISEHKSYQLKQWIQVDGKFLPGAEDQYSSSTE